VDYMCPLSSRSTNMTGRSVERYSLKGWVDRAVRMFTGSSSEGMQDVCVSRNIGIQSGIEVGYKHWMRDF
jgi:hypothetical protein